MKRYLWALVLLAACSKKEPTLVSGSVTEQVTVFQNVAVFSGKATDTVAAQDVWVRGATIAYVGPAGERALPAGATVVAGEGRTLLPGLIDMHTHAHGGSAPPWKLGLPDPERNLKTFLAAGITTIVDLGGPMGDVIESRDAIAAGELPGPRMLVSGPHFTAPGGHPVAMLRIFAPWIVTIFLEPAMAYQVGAVDEVEDIFDEFLSYKPDVVKLVSDQIPLGIPTIAPDVSKEIIERAHAAGLKTFAHVGDNADAQKMALAGVDILAHGLYREPISEATAKLLAERGIKVTPTLAVFDHIDRMTAGDYELSPMQLALGDEDTVEAIRHRPADYQLDESLEGWTHATHANRDVKFANVATLRAHGVTILVGSDAPNIGQFGGASLHDEMELLVQAGMTPAEVLQAATYENAKALGLEKNVGTVEVGKAADLLLVRGNPAAEITAVHAVEAVYLGGRKYEGKLD